jgi:D-arabinose 1-dehydrogenase-like Zn-dependent alcohol dehydrogenase
MQVAGIRRLGARVELIEVGEPRPLAGDEVLLEVGAAGVASWDEFVRTGGWDVGAAERRRLRSHCVTGHPASGSL